MTAHDAPRRGLTLIVEAVKGRLYVNVRRRVGTVRAAVDQPVARFAVDLGDDLDLDEPGALLLALSDALAQAADTFPACEDGRTLRVLRP